MCFSLSIRLSVCRNNSISFNVAMWVNRTDSKTRDVMTDTLIPLNHGGILIEIGISSCGEYFVFDVSIWCPHPVDRKLNRSINCASHAT